MNRLRDAIDMGVIIGRVRLRATSPEGRAPFFEPSWPARARAGDHRIIVGELCIETDAQLPELEVRGLGERVARALGERLAELQSRRLEALRAGRSRGGTVRIRSLRAVLRGSEAERPDARAIALALSGAVEQGVVP